MALSHLSRLNLTFKAQVYNLCFFISRYKHIVGGGGGRTGAQGLVDVWYNMVVWACGARAVHLGNILV